MPILIMHTADGMLIEHEFQGELRIGAASNDDLRLIDGHSIAPHHAVIARSAIYQVPILVDLTNEEAWTGVNGRRVIRLKALRHKDVIEVGGAQLEFWEMVTRSVTHGSQLDGKICPVCYTEILPGEEIIACPRCQTAHHKEHWFEIPTCSTYACGYPVQETLRRVLAPHMSFEKLTEEHKLVKEQTRCTAENSRDKVAFKDEEDVTFCPQCNRPYHVECWLLLPQCRSCGFDITHLLQSVFTPAAPVSVSLVRQP